MAAAMAPPTSLAHVRELLQGAPRQPKVEAKELEGVVLLRKRRGLERLDMSPFALLYALITAALMSQAIGGHW